MIGLSVAAVADPAPVPGVVGAVAPDVGAGPTVSVEPSVVIVCSPVIVEPEGSVRVIDEPSGSVSVSTFDPALEVGSGPTVSVEPSVVIVSSPVIDEPEGRVRIIVEPSGSVRVSTTFDEPDELVVGTGPTVRVEPSVVIVVNPVIDEPGGKVRVTDEPSGSVRVSTMLDEGAGLDVGAGPTVSVEPSVTMVVKPVIEEPGGRVKVIDEPSGSVRVSITLEEIAELEVGAGPTVKVEPSVVRVVKPVIDEPAPRVKVIDEPSGSVNVWTFDAVLVDVPRVNVCPLVVRVVGPVIDGKVKVTGTPLVSVVVMTVEPGVDTLVVEDEVETVVPDVVMLLEEIEELEDKLPVPLDRVPVLVVDVELAD